MRPNNNVFCLLACTDGLDPCGDGTDTQVVTTATADQSGSSAARRQLRRGLAEVVRRMRDGLTSCTADTKDVHVPLYVSLLVLVGYVLLGALLFGLWEPDWDVLVGSYLVGSYFALVRTVGTGLGRSRWMYL